MGNLEDGYTLRDAGRLEHPQGERRRTVLLTMSPCIIRPEAVAYQNLFEGDFKRIVARSK